MERYDPVFGRFECWAVDHIPLRNNGSDERQHYLLWVFVHLQAVHPVLDCRNGVGQLHWHEELLVACCSVGEFFGC